MSLDATSDKERAGKGKLTMFSEEVIVVLSSTWLQCHGMSRARMGT